MEAGILLILSIIIVLLQIIILINQFNIKKIIITESISKDNFTEKSLYSNKESESKSRWNKSLTSSTPSTNVITNKNDKEEIEKSLRNINLKLKNAERDQEAARKKVQENINGPLVKEKNQSNNFHYGKDRKKDYHNNKKHRKDNHNRNFSASRQDGSYNRQQQNVAVKEEEKKDITPAVPTSSFEELKPVDFNVDNTEHGRKFIVKRRLLKDEAETTNPQSEPQEKIEGSLSLPAEESIQNDTSTPIALSETSSSNTNMKHEKNSDEEILQPAEEASKLASEDSEISFGRR